MCGIIGEINRQSQINIDTFNIRRDTLIHRGPDGFDSTLLSDNHVALGHRRLSIIDLSEAGKQPMSNEDGTVWLTYNGEIYNFRELKNELLKKNHVFKSHTDSEVLIHGYEEWGAQNFLNKLKGMFAFAIWDENKKILFAARDRFGIKPFYYYQDTNKFTFASEIKAIVKDATVDSGIDFTAIADFLIYRFIPSPKSIYKKIKKLAPANYLIFDFKNNSVDVKRYWELSFNASGKYDFKDIISNTDQLLQRSVQEHLISDVPIGVFLSGGYDSSALLYYLNQNGYPMQSFSIGFKGWAKSEHEYARIVANKFESKHFEKILPSDLGENLSSYVYFYDEPLGGTSFMPTFAVSKFAGERVKVVMGGDGGDEVFLGYNWHYKILNNLKTAKGYLKSKLNGPEYIINYYRQLMNWSGFNYQEVYKILNIPLSDHPVPSDNWLYEQYDNPLLPAAKRIQLFDFYTFLPEVINTKVDRASMAHSLEVRVPFLDHELVEYVFNLPVKYYYQKGIKKKLLFELLKMRLPKEILFKNKQGFGAPVNHHNKIGQNLLNGFMIKEGILSKKSVENFIKYNENGKIWALHILDNWFKSWGSAA